MDAASRSMRPVMDFEAAEAERTFMRALVAAEIAETRPGPFDIDAREW